MFRDSYSPIDVSVSDLPYQVIDEEIYIPISDGTRLAARIWKPVASRTETFPSLLEYIPYRKRDDTRVRDEERHAYLAGHGYVCVRVDMRGSGDSEGIQLDEYLPIEQQDGLEIIDWLSKQSWSTGNVGMFGLSWGGITSLQLATPQPLFMKTWLEHQQRDDYWLQGSVCTDYSRIEIPVYAVCGWTDCWPNTVMRLMKNLTSARKGLIGPWSHLYPDRALPGPGVNFLDEMLRWFDRWLKGIENGIEDEPMLTLFRQEDVPVDPRHNWRDGVWLDAQSWPDESLMHREIWLSPEGTSDSPAQGQMSINSPQSTGMMSGDYMPGFGDIRKAQMPGDQRNEDAGSLCFDMPIQSAPLDIIGTTTAEFEVSSDAGNGLLAVRLCDVARDGSSTLITYGVMNLAQRDGREVQAPVVPDERYSVSLTLNDTAYRILKGHKLRIAVSNAMWPMAWPVADNHNLTVHLAGSRIILPNADLQQSDGERVIFEPSRVAETSKVSVLEPGLPSRTILEDLSTGKRTLTIRNDFGKTHLSSSDLVVSGFTQDQFEISDTDVHSATADYQFSMGYTRDGWDVETFGQMTMTCDQDAFFLRGEVRALENGQEICCRRWDERIPRKGF